MYKKIYFMGIKGVGMATLAVMAKEAGFIVSGSDVAEEFITDKILKETGIEVLEGFKEENPKEFFGTTPVSECLFIATGAHDGFENAEAEFASSKNIKVISHGQAVGLFMSGELFGRTDFEGVSVSGAHGKTTIASMIASCMVSLNLDPSYTIGTSEINPIGAAGHFGKGKYFIAEADEYLSEMQHDRTAKLLYQKPKYLIINNIDFDHPDFYKDIHEVKDVFKKFVQQIEPGGYLIINGDDENAKGLRTIDIRLKTITYGTGSDNEFILENFRQHGLSSSFEVKRKGTSIGRFELSVPGYHNAKNSLAVIALLMELGISIVAIQKVLSSFKGSKRRFEEVGTTASGVKIIDDYAHHPEEIRKTLEAAAAGFPDKKITLIFQAHTFARTRSLLSEFASSFAGVDELIILPTFSSARDAGAKNLEEDRAFVEKIRTTQPNVKLIEKAQDVVEYVKNNIKSPDNLVITMGAGNVYHIGEKLVTRD